ncbi:MAG: ROK family transcriptional regulator [Actinomycetota bacterium]
MSPARHPGLRSELIRTQNLATVLRFLHLDGQMSRSEIGRRTGLTRSSIGTLVTDLIALGYVEEIDPDRSGNPGRPSPIVRPLAERTVTVGVDLMVDSIGVAVVGLGGVVLRSVRRDRARESQSPETSVGDAVALIHQALGTLDDAARVVGVGVAVPGLVAHGPQRVVLAPNLGWSDVDIVELVKGQVPDTSVLLGNEADLGALAESRRGAAAGRRDVLYLSGEVGVGGGIIADGVLLTGRGGFAGEVGHIPVNPDGRLCGCGAVGCLETEIGEKALLRRAGRPENGGRPEIDALLRDARAGTPTVVAALEEHARWLAIGLAGLMNVLDVEIVVLGGLHGRVYPHITRTLTAELGRRVLPTQRDIPVVAAELGDDSALIGASELMWDSVLAELAAG